MYRRCICVDFLASVVCIFLLLILSEASKPKISAEGEVIMKEMRNLIARVERNCKANSKAKNQIKTDIQGGMYVRWGKTSCPSDGTELVYSGQMGGSHYMHTGAAVNYLCLPNDPLWGSYDDRLSGAAFVYGAESDTHFVNIPNTPFQHKNHMKDLPCAVCRSLRRSSVLMIPGRNACYKGWHLEYDGYLSAGHHTHKAASEYICVDKKLDHMRGGGTQRTLHTMIYQVEVQCIPLRCPPYVSQRELTCAVCTK